jgi:zinc D-Ala-D-Ala carboxypeptidase
MQLSPNFTLAELTKSQTATRLGMNNTPTPEVITNLRALCINVLEPIRAHFKAPVIISSGYRCKALNNAVGGSKTSQHMTGKAADIEVYGKSNWDVLDFIEKNLVFDQLIQEFMKVNNPTTGWVHVSYNEEGNRKQFLIVR